MRKVTFRAFAVRLSFAASLFMFGKAFAQVPSYVPTNGLVGWWPFNGNANDESGNGRNGTVTGVTLVADRLGNANAAYSFNGTSNFISVPNPIGVSFSSGISISIWAKIAGLNSNTNCSLGCSQFLVSRGNDGSNGHFKIGYNQNQITSGGQKFGGGVNSFSGGGGVVASTASPYPQTTWQHLVLTYNNSQLKIYLNGLLASTTNYTTPISNLTNLIYFGRHELSSYPYFVNGLLDDIGIWNRALTQQEITTLYNVVNCNVTATTTQTNVSCNGGNNGTATVSSSGGTAPYTYSWSPSGGTSATASNLAAGTYTCTILDANQCSATKTVTITQPTAVTATTTQTNVSTNGGNNGSATVTVSGGTLPYAYSWAPTGGNSGTATGLVAGSYTCTITDANNCVTNQTVTITQPAPVSNCLPSYVPTNGLVGWWPFCGNANDESGNGNNGTVTGATLTTDRFGQANSAYLFSNSYIEVQPLSTLNGATNFSLCAWVYLDPTASNGQNYVLSRGWDYSNGFNLYVNQNGAAQIINGFYTFQKFSTVQPMKGNWHQVVVSRSGSTVNFYMDGSLDTTHTYSAPVGTNSELFYIGVHKWIGQQPGYYPYYFKGKIDDVGIWNRALTQQEVTALYNNFNCNVTASATQTNVSCNGGNNGTATVSSSGGTAPYTYSWSPSGGTSATASNMAAGTYTCTVKDVNQCSATKTVTITQPTAVTATTTQTNVSCNGGNNGTATVTSSGGTAPYTYSWSPSGGTTATASNLVAGTYTCTVKDVNQCSSLKTVTITQPTVLLAATTQTNVSCNGGNNGIATASASGGSAPYTYSWSPSGATTATQSNLAAGTYTCTVKDVNQCSATKTVTITQPAAVTATTTQTNVGCNGGNNGTATTTASGGTAPYTYSWSPSGGTVATATNLAAGTYTCMVKDVNQCSVTKTVTITQPTALVAATTQTNVSCNGGNNGTATVLPSGGTSPYTYSWSTSGGTAATAVNLGSGTYTCTVKDVNQCSATKTVTITQPTAVTATITQTNVSCNGGNNGSAIVTATGGTAPFTYSWSPSGGTAATASNLATGTYTCTILDANQCSATKTVAITQPAVLMAATTQTNVSCNGGNNGSATATASGGTAPYTYSWSPSGATTATASNLAAGSYTCTVNDSKQCTTSKNVVITQPLSLLATVSPTINYVQTGSNGTFNAVSQNSSANFIWQTKHVGLNWQQIPSNSFYSGSNTNSLTVNNVQVSNHLQSFRVVTFSGNCSDTSSSVVLHISDTCIVTLNDTNYVTITDTNIVTIYDTLYTSVTDTLIINTTLSLPAPNNENTILIYPNPASDHITIDNGNYTAMAGYTIRIENNAGQQVFQSAINQQQFYVDLSSWTGKGLYFVHLIDSQNNTVTIRKIVLQ
jgi:hypothetical protein